MERRDGSTDRGWLSRAVGRSVAGRRGVALGSLLAAAAVLIPLLQQIFGRYDARPEITIALTLALACAAEGTRRLRAAEQRAAAEAKVQALLAVPPVDLGAADPVRLGVFPAARDLPRDPLDHYVERAAQLDASVREALQPGALVLLVGPPHAGKSRTALEAARQAANGAAVIAPRGPSELQQLLSGDARVAVDSGTSGRVVWLDSLERYARMLDAAALDRLARLGAPDGTPDAAIVATVRATDWERLLAAAGDEGAAARAIAARARTFVVPDRLEPAEVERARELFGDRDFARGLGLAVATTGAEPVPPVPPRPLPAAVFATRRGRLAWLRSSPAAAGVAAAACLAGLGVTWAVAGFSEPTLDDRIDEIESRAAEAGLIVRRPAGDAVRMRPAGESHLFLFQDSAGRRSDELRIYDRDGDDLELRWRFRPGGAPRATYQFRAAGDVDDDGAVEVVGGFSRQRTQREALLPFAIEWDKRRRRYGMVVLELGPPRLANLRLGGAAGNQAGKYRREYREVVEYRDPANGRRIAGRRVQDFIVRSRQHRLVAAYFLKPPLHSADDAIVAVRAAMLHTGTGGPELLPCAVPGAQTRAPAPAGWALTGVLDDYWSRVAPAGRCVPVSTMPRSSASKRSPSTRQS